MPIGSARQLPDGSAALIAGVLTTDLGALETGHTAFIEDETGGIALYLDAPVVAALPVGTDVTVAGTIDERYGQRTLRTSEAAVVVGGSTATLEAATALDRQRDRGPGRPTDRGARRDGRIRGCARRRDRGLDRRRERPGSGHRHARGTRGPVPRRRFDRHSDGATRTARQLRHRDERLSALRDKRGRPVGRGGTDAVADGHREPDTGTDPHADDERAARAVADPIALTVHTDPDPEPVRLHGDRCRARPAGWHGRRDARRGHGRAGSARDAIAVRDR